MSRILELIALKRVRVGGSFKLQFSLFRVAP